MGFLELIVSFTTVKGVLSEHICMYSGYGKVYEFDTWTEKPSGFGNV